MTDVRKGQGDVALPRAEFERRFRERFFDPGFAHVSPEVDRVVDVAWKVYHEYHKSPRTQPAGPGFADPAFPLPVEWLEAREHIQQAARRSLPAALAGQGLSGRRREH